MSEKDCVLSLPEFATELKHIRKQLEKIDRAVCGVNSEPGLLMRVDRLEQVERRRIDRLELVENRRNLSVYGTLIMVVGLLIERFLSYLLGSE